MKREKIGILISGRGSNMSALIEAARGGGIPADIALVISNIESAAGLTKARDHGIETAIITHRGCTRAEHDQNMVELMRSRGVSLVCLAGYMRLVSPVLIRAFPDRILNIHPSLLPAFPGLDAQRQALEYGAKITGCTVHLVDEELDHGPIVIQRAVEVLPGDSIETLSDRILAREHEIYPQAVERVLRPEFRVIGRRTFWD
jgi:phosphoribosylglycinamide formyltransferase 1